ncbi:unnamed protein product [Somion occarium]|uniref:Uncharacterized protein n=1 Tax=Somion occarium TaxID=3059160 RepID=A0ABP1EBB9_9APHY
MMYIPQLTSTVIQHSTPSATLANLSCRFETGTISPSIIGIIVCRVRESNSNSPRYGIVHVKSVEQFGIRPSALTFEHSNLPVEVQLDILYLGGSKRHLCTDMKSGFAVLCLLGGVATVP